MRRRIGLSVAIGVQNIGTRLVASTSLRYLATPVIETIGADISFFLPRAKDDLPPSRLLVSPSHPLRSL